MNISYSSHTFLHICRCVCRILQFCTHFLDMSIRTWHFLYIISYNFCYFFVYFIRIFIVFIYLYFINIIYNIFLCGIRFSNQIWFEKHVLAAKFWSLDLLCVLESVIVPKTHLQNENSDFNVFQLKMFFKSNLMRGSKLFS